MEAPTPTAVRDFSSVLQARLPADSGGANDEYLARAIGVECAVVGRMTGRQIGSTKMPGCKVDDWLEPVAVKAIALRIERSVIQGQRPKRREATVEGARLSSFSAGPYSESYQPMAAEFSGHVLDPDREIHDLLWELCTENKRGYWRAYWGGYNVPASAVQTVPWSVGPRVRQGY
jgi:hypothetical protein